MRGDLPEPALRLLCELPVRTHERYEPENRVDWRKYHKRAIEKRGSSNQCRPLRYNGQTYKSITDAKRSLRISPQTLYRLIDAGEAVYL